MEDLLIRLKLYLGISENNDDNLLLFLLEVAGKKILERLYPFDGTALIVPERYKFKQIEIAQFLYNKRGAEGEVAHSENGVNRTYEGADIPPSMLRGIVPFVGSPRATI